MTMRGGISIVEGACLGSVLLSAGLIGLAWKYQEESRERLENFQRQVQWVQAQRLVEELAARTVAQGEMYRLMEQRKEREQVFVARFREALAADASHRFPEREELPKLDEGAEK